MIKVSAEIKQEDIRNLIKTFSGDLVRKATRSAIDRTGTWSKDYIANAIAQNYNLKVPTVKKAIKVNRTTQTKLSAELITRGTALTLIDNFKAIQDAIGISATISPGWIKRVPHAFINRPKGSSKKVIMMRAGKKRYPTTGKAGYGPPIPALLGRTNILTGIKEKMNDHLYKELADQISKRTLGQTQIIETE